MSDGLPEHPVRFRTDSAMPRFWPPRQSPFWMAVSEPVRRYMARATWRVAEVDVGPVEALYRRFGPGDGVLLAPNHSHAADAHVMHEAARRVGRRFYYMAAWEAFTPHGGLEGWVLQRWGAFSVDREGCDRRSLRQAADLLCAGESLVIFPEGEIHHLNERIRPLLDGVAFIALSAQHSLERAGSAARIWLVPTAIRYRFVGDVIPRLEAAMKRLEERLLWWKAPRNASLPERIVRFGEALLTLKEKEKLGRSREQEADLPGRIDYLIDALLRRHEEAFPGKTAAAGATTALRVKGLRRRLLDLLADEAAGPERRLALQDALDDIQLALQLYSYPGDYLQERPSPERMAETIEKYEEDLFGRSRCLGQRRARILYGEPLDMQREREGGRGHALVHDLTDRLEREIQRLLSAG